MSHRLSRAARGPALVVLLGVAACGDGREPGVRVHAGNTLLDHLDAIVVETHPSSNLPPGLVEEMRALMRSGAWVLRPEEWRAGEPTTPSGLSERRIEALLSGLQVLLGEGGASRRCRPAVRLDLPVGDVWLRRDGEVVADKSYRAQGREQRVWLDAPRRALFWWDGAEGELVAFGERPAAPVELGYRLPPGWTGAWASSWTGSRRCSPVGTCS